MFINIHRFNSEMSKTEWMHRLLSVAYCALVVFLFSVAYDSGDWLIALVAYWNLIGCLNWCLNAVRFAPDSLGSFGALYYFLFRPDQMVVRYRKHRRLIVEIATHPKWREHVCDDEQATKRALVHFNYLELMKWYHELSRQQMRERFERAGVTELHGKYWQEENNG